MFKSSFKSEAIYSYAQNYISINYKQRYNQKAIIILNNMFSNVTPQEIDNDFVVSCIKHDSIGDGKDLLILTDFICHLINTGIRFNKSQLFLEYIPYINNSSVSNSKKVIIMNSVLTNERVENYYHHNLINDLTTLTVNLDFIEPQGLINPKDKIIIDDYLDTFKLNKTFSILSLKNMIRIIKLTVNELLIKKPLDTINPYDIAYLFERYSVSCENTRQLTRFCFYLVDIKYYVDGRFDFLNNLSIIDNGINIKILINIFSNLAPWKYNALSYRFNNNSDRTYNFILYIDCNNFDLINNILNYLKTKRFMSNGIESLCNNFNRSLGHHRINHVFDFNYVTFLQQVSYIRDVLDKTAMSFIVGFYNYLAQDINPDIFSDTRINPSILLRQNLPGELMDGYIITPFNPSDTPPEYDKILLHHYQESRTNTSNNTSKLFAFDFTQIKCTSYRGWVKRYIWSPTGISDKKTKLTQSAYFLNFIHSLKNGEILSIYSRRTTNIKITALEVQAFKVDCDSNQFSESTTCAYINNAKNLLSFILNNDGEIVEASTIYHLGIYSSNQSKSNKMALSNDEVSRLSVEIGRSVSENPENFLYYVIFRLMIETELRFSHIIALRISCINEAQKKNEYVLLSYDKTSHGEERPIPIALTTKHLLDELESFTKPQRKLCSNQHIKDHLFIKKGHKYNSTSIANSTGFRRFLKICCKNANIDIYNPENIRETHMTNAQKYIIQKSLTDIELSTLSGHASKDVTLNHYVDWSIKEMLEAVHGITIENVTVSGKILFQAPKDIESGESLVSDECGYCDIDSCNDFSFLGCLMCNDFVATVDRIPFFKNQIAVMDTKIKNAQILHDRESYYNIKRLLVAYLCELLKLQKGL